MNPEVDTFIAELTKWQDETTKLRAILLGCGLVEELKWGKPSYLYGGTIVVVIQGFNDYFAMLLMKGVLLEDPADILVKTGENTRVGRQIRFKSARDIGELEPLVKEYVGRAIEIERAGLKVPADNNEGLIYPDEFQQRLDELPALKTAFDGLTPGRQRAYIYYFSAPKQSSTRLARVDKCTDLILDGLGLND